MFKYNRNPPVSLYTMYQNVPSQYDIKVVNAHLQNIDVFVALNLTNI